jgi:hypothetical protein
MCKTAAILIALGGVCQSARAQNLTVKGSVHTGLVNSDSWFPFTDGNSYVRGSLYVQAYPGYADRLSVLASSGRVGVLTQSPQGTLHVAADGNAMIVGATVSSALVLWPDPSTANGPAEIYPSTTHLRFGTQTAYGAVGWVERMRLTNAGRLGIGTAAPAAALEVNGGARLNTTAAKPACSVSQRGTFWVTQGAAGVKDSVQVCAKDAANAYAWRTIY